MKNMKTVQTRKLWRISGEDEIKIHTDAKGLVTIRFGTFFIERNPF